MNKINYGHIFKEFVESVGYELLSEYKNSYTKVILKCSKGHEYNVTPNNFKSLGRRCAKCAGKCPIQAKEQFIRLVIQEGYELLSEYRNNYTKVILKCDSGHEYKTIPKDFKFNHRCPKCVNLCPIQAKERFIGLVTQEGYELLNEYINTRTKVLVKCPENHIWNVKPNDFNGNVRCPHCVGSTGQRLLQEKLKLLINEEVIYNDRKLLDGLELDIYYPKLNIAIEYQGNYWHSLPDNMERDKRKKILCKEKGIKLIEVWDEDFLEDSDKMSDNIYNEIIGHVNNVF